MICIAADQAKTWEKAKREAAMQQGRTARPEQAESARDKKAKEAAEGAAKAAKAARLAARMKKLGAAKEQGVCFQFVQGICRVGGLHAEGCSQGKHEVQSQ